MFWAWGIDELKKRLGIGKLYKDVDGLWDTLEKCLRAGIKDVADFYPYSNKFIIRDNYWHIENFKNYYYVEADLRPKGIFKFKISSYKFEICRIFGECTFEDMAKCLKEIISNLDDKKKQAEKALIGINQIAQDEKRFIKEQEDAISYYE